MSVEKVHLPKLSSEISSKDLGIKKTSSFWLQKKLLLTNKKQKSQ
jgi:hypothetical protein